MGYGGGIINRKVILSVLLVLTMALSLNAVSSAAVNQTLTDETAQDNQLNKSKQSNIINSSQNTTYRTGTTNNSSDRYEGTPDTDTGSTVSTSATGMAAAGSSVIKVLIYSGTGASTSCVNGVKSAMASANNNNLISGVTFSYATSSTLTSSILSGYDLLVMPGGSGGSVYLNTISKSVIQNFVKNGGGYLGICAGAYAAAAHTDGYYDGWGIAPHVRAKAVSYEGKLGMNITSTGAQVLGRNGTLNISHYNGAAMYITSSTAKILATYADGKTGYEGYADIVGDFYGNGRTVLVGSHPELSPQFPDIIANLMLWATGTSSSNTTSNTTSGTKVTISQVVNAAVTVKNYYDKNKRLPSYVTINSSKISMAKFLYLLTSATKQLGSGSTTSTSITVKSVSAASGESGSYQAGSLAKSEYLTLAQKVMTFINKNGRAPNYVTTSLGKVKYSKMIYMFSKILKYYKSYSRLPNYIQISA